MNVGKQSCVVLWLRQKTQLRWLPHHCQSNDNDILKLSFAVDVDMDVFLISFWLSGYLLREELQCSVMIEAIYPSNVTPISMSNTHKVFCILHVWWMCTYGWVLVTSFLALARLAYLIFLRMWATSLGLRLKDNHSNCIGIIEPILEPSKMAPTSWGFRLIQQDSSNINVRHISARHW